MSGCTPNGATGTPVLITKPARWNTTTASMRKANRGDRNWRSRLVHDRLNCVLRKDRLHGAVRLELCERRIDRVEELRVALADGDRRGNRESHLVRLHDLEAERLIRRCRTR